MFTDLLYRLRALFYKQTVEEELRAELELHLEHEAQKYMRRGIDREQALRRAKLALQSVETAKEKCRDVRGTRWLEDAGRDLEYGWRQLRGSPGFATVAVLVMAFGIGANTAIFSLLNAVMLRSVPVDQPSSLFTLKWTAKSAPKAQGYSSFEHCYGTKDSDNAGCSFSPAVFEQFRTLRDVFSGVAAMAGPAQLNWGGVGEARIVAGEVVSGEFFHTLGVGAALGRPLEESDDQPKASPAVVLSYGFWQTAFGGQSSAVGRVVRLNNAAFTVVGIADPHFNRLSPGRHYDLWLPFAASKQLNIGWDSGDMTDEKNWWLTVVVRVRDGVAPSQAQARVSALFHHLLLSGSKLAKAGSDPAITLVEANRGFTGVRAMLEKPLYLLMCAVGLILLIACANVAGLLMARAATRRREMAVRLAIGAGKARIVRQLLTESLLLSLAGGVLGVLFAYGFARSLAVFVPGAWELNVRIGPDLPVLGFTAAISIASGLFFGIVPALRAASADPGATTLPQAMSNSGRRSRFASALVVVQIALSVVMLMGAGLLMRTLSNLRSVNPGFDARNILLFGVDPKTSGYKPEAARRFYLQLQERLAALPGVSRVSYSSDALLAGGLSSTRIQIEGRNNQPDVPVQILWVGPGFFETMHIARLAGRAFTPAELAAGQPVAAVNQAFVRRYLANRSPLGLHFGGDIKKPQRQIVALVADAKYDNLRREVEPTAYVPIDGGSFAHFEVRAAINGESFARAAQKTVRDLDENVPAFDLKTQTEQIDELLFVERLVARLTSVFGLLALLLTSIGVFGLLSYEVTRRTRETGIRLAIGAQPSAVTAALLREAGALVLAGTLIGVPASLAISRALKSLLFGVKENDPPTLAGALAVLFIVALLATLVPARRTARIDPAVALRHE